LSYKSRTKYSRVTAKFSLEQKKVLDELAKEQGAPLSHVLRSALALLKLAIEERKKGNSLAFVKDQRILKVVIGLWGE